MTLTTMRTPSTSRVQLTPSSSPIPGDYINEDGTIEANEVDSASPSPKGIYSLPQPTPKLRLHLEDLTKPASKAFINLIPDPNAAINTALGNIVTYLYISPSEPSQAGNINSGRDGSHAHRISPHFDPSLPATRSVTFLVRDMPGVAYTTGTDLDKEIHVSLSYIATVSSTSADPARELRGVITHELVHCYQHTRPHSNAAALHKNGEMEPNKAEPESAIPNPPSGLIEGVADFVRLKAGLAPPHWKRPRSKAERGSSWDKGYQVTAFFLEWIEDVKVGEGAVGMLNDRLLRVGYVGESGGHESAGGDGNGGAVEKADRKRAGVVTDEQLVNRGFWYGLFGAEVLDLWDEYGAYLDSSKTN
ncbi:PBSP domain-containing protein [Histoplasma ohiense]|nr:PBSP domain-containing protein [Histoplasma ohiense (nom. inval.)]